MLHGQQGMDFRGVEPQARQLVLAARARGAVLEAVTARLAVPDQRAVEAVAQVLDVALERGGRDFQDFEQLGEAHQLALADELVDLVEAFGAIHAGLRLGDGPILCQQAHPVSPGTAGMHRMTHVPSPTRITPALVEAIRSRYALEWHGIHGVNPWAQARAFQAWKYSYCQQAAYSQ